ncbi:FAD-dependent monooxygenase [Micromonospora sp. NPDC005172]|uniref:FAD-dependent monooxygenase n=1 Tax=Micromonospora sp. NPDC005172 TaxID=3156867 RepID=UPI0033ABED63
MTDLVPDPAVLVVGAGPTGLTLACELARRDIPVRIIEAAAEPRAGSRGKGMQPRTLEVLDDLGLAAAAVANGRFRMLLRKYLPNGETITHEVLANAAEPSAATPYTRPLMIAQYRTEALLRTRLAEFGVQVEQNTRLLRFSQDEAGVSAWLDADGAEAEVRVAYLVGCDGGSSLVRKQSGIAFVGETDEDSRWLVADVELAGLDRDFWYQWIHASGAGLALCPLPGINAFQLQTAVPADSATTLSTDAMQALISDISGRADILIQHVRWQSIWRANARLAERYRVGRIFLAGDAAHVHTPAGAQGMNTGIQDAYNLGWKLAHAVSGAPDALLDTYQEERQPVALDVLGLSAKMFGGGLATVLPKDGQQQSVTQLGVRYPTSSLSELHGEVAAGVLTAGDRAPGGMLVAANGDAVRLFDLFRGTHVTALAFGAGSAEVAGRLVERFPEHVRAYRVLGAGQAADGRYTDPTGDVFANYDATDGTLVLVRPDGYVGVRATDPDEDRIVSYLRRLVPAHR